MKFWKNFPQGEIVFPGSTTCLVMYAKQLIWRKNVTVIFFFFSFFHAAMSIKFRWLWMLFFVTWKLWRFVLTFFRESDWYKNKKGKMISRNFHDLLFFRKLSYGVGIPILWFSRSSFIPFGKAASFLGDSGQNSLQCLSFRSTLDAIHVQLGTLWEKGEFA